MKSRFELVFFDVDSTLVAIEGIDELAAGDLEIERMTESAMNGEIAIEDVYRLRLERIRPSERAVAALAARYLETLVPGSEATVRALRDAHVDVHLVTAGIRQAVAPLAAKLGLAPRALHAVELRFDARGEYAGYDEASPLARAGGRQRTEGLFAEDILCLGSNWIVTAAVRFDHWRNFDAQATRIRIPPAGPTTGSAFAERTESAFNPRLSVLRRLSANVSLTA